MDCYCRSGQSEFYIIGDVPVGVLVQCFGKIDLEFGTHGVFASPRHLRTVFAGHFYIVRMSRCRFGLFQFGNPSHPATALQSYKLGLVRIFGYVKRVARNSCTE